MKEETGWYWKSTFNNSVPMRKQEVKLTLYFPIQENTCINVLLNTCINKCINKYKNIFLYRKIHFPACFYQEVEIS